MKILAALSAAFLGVFVLLLVHQPNVSYSGGDIEIECASVWTASSGDGPAVSTNGAGSGSRVVHGQDVLIELAERTGEDAAAIDSIRTQLDARCIDRRARSVLLAQLALLGFVGCGTTAAVLARQRYRQRPPAYVPPNVRA